ncbi:hypothetical protein EC957_007964 [Mortierella hygrophila]|uniref:Uncharacterized protein n=1 Tax=Mortierella hygrophila TaxID=979708 RepID=A0A9P6EXC1_9FUNG|nr:hypothetical protein EC957_007964 [Mortierella hygrophila]
MSTHADLWWYGPRILIGAVALASISSEITEFLKEMELIKDLPSDAAMARFIAMIIPTVFFIGIQAQRITTCFTSTTFFAQLTFYIWTVECFFKTCILFGSIALLSFDKDFADKMAAKGNDPKANTADSEPMFWLLFYGSFCVGIGLRIVLNELRTRDREAERQREALLRIAKGMAPFPGSSGIVLTEEAARRQLIKRLAKLYRINYPSGTSMVNSLTDAISADDPTIQNSPFASAVLVDIVDISCDLLLVWSMWQIVKDLEERNDRIAKARIESRAAAAAAAAAAASSATFKDENGASIYHVYHERGQQSSAAGV